MQQVMAIKHVGFEHLGTLATLLTQMGFSINYMDMGMVDLPIIDALQHTHVNLRLPKE